LQVHYRSDGEIVAEVGPLLLRAINGAATTHESVEHLFTLVERLLVRWPIIAVLVVVEHGTPRPTPEIRHRIDEALRRYSERIVMGYVFLGLGFWTVDAREFAADRAATLPMPVFVELGVHELATRIGRELLGVDPELIERSFEQLRAELGLAGI
jgi:hypothetical protein